MYPFILSSLALKLFDVLADLCTYYITILMKSQ
uniref:Uncharacterized protein n=1 Tax=Siphoviridae sp. ctgN495 TaxID=2825608 RepID=A0A8S5UCC1_9CAUD|nr:MAG TPA: hypothetical protein [Siphoviridae sp. ctgN495]